VLKWNAVGHAGTLDPPATGVLIILCGKATRRADEFMNLPKEYVARVRFGVNTSTDDLDGDIVETRFVTDWSAEHIAATLEHFTGAIEQVPPAVSDVKIGGRRSYALARSGQAVDLAPRPVTVYELEVLSLQQPEIELRVCCSRGTYIRSLARDLGEMLGWGGALAALSRTAIGPYRVDTALTLKSILDRSSEFVSE
jgi:tRNA pseudouridine55 synthase